MNIHPTAIISKEAVIEDGVIIEPYVVIEGEVIIKKGSKIGSHTVIKGPTTIGENNEISPFVSLGQDPQDVKYSNERTELIIGNNNRIREFATLHRGTEAAGKTVIGDGNLFLAYTHIAHDCIVGDNCILSNNATLAGHVELGNNIVVGGLTPVHQFVKVGDHAMIGGASAVNKDVLPFTLVEGNRAKTFGINAIGLSRRGFGDEEILILKDAYKVMFRSKLLLADAIRTLKEKYPSDKNVKQILDFAEKSERGLCR